MTVQKIIQKDEEILKKHHDPNQNQQNDNQNQNQNQENDKQKNNIKSIITLTNMENKDQPFL